MFFPMVPFGSSLYLIGGLDQFGTHSHVITQYDIENDVWDESYGSMPVGRSKHCAVEFNDEIWIIGGER